MIKDHFLYFKKGNVTKDRIIRISSTRGKTRHENGKDSRSSKSKMGMFHTMPGVMLLIYSFTIT